ncbi:Ancient ubiquitous protein 1 [Phytophthora pseudosyringae]|uniref:Ancient ubiquitous protein 1 n=1 Tax=Phytophthora pseudosyringae TaxID=221518 RepID=A0A8T1VLM5_9STRA|nr:Ancient ubiquitous protein 1 [Phytophthora pseudosyringae]
MAPSVMGSPIAPFLDLSMASQSPTVHGVRHGLNQLGDGKVSVTLDPPTEQQLLPFESMFQFQRIKSPWLTVGHLLLLLYTPLGLLLLLVRGTGCFLVALVIPRVLSEEQMDRLHVARLFVWLTGTRLCLVDDHLFKTGENRAEIIVSNHISEFDAVAMLGITPAYLLGYDFYKKLLFFKLLGDKAGLVYVPYVSRQEGNGAGRDAVRQIIMERLARGDKPLAAFPEGGLTNGRKGLLQYHKFLFSLDKTVQPLAIRASDGPFVRRSASLYRRTVPVNINDETSTFLANVLWYLFVPWHTYTVQFLPCTKAEPGEDPLIIAQRVMKMTADALEQQASPFMYRDKIAYVRYKAHQLKKNKG